MNLLEFNKTTQNLFSDRDKQILHDGMFEVLSNQEFKLVILIFWKNQLLHEISEQTSIPVAELQKTMDRAMQKLKQFCLNQQDFSRSPSLITSIAA